MAAARAIILDMDGTLVLPANAAGQVVVVGDDPAPEMRLAHHSGAMGIAVTTGLQNRAAFACTAAAEKPHVVLDSREPIVEALNCFSSIAAT